MTDLRMLLEPFEASDHEFDYGGHIYIDETAITNRLDTVCGIDGWSILQPHLPIKVTQNHWGATIELSILTHNGWVSRTGTGEGITAIPGNDNDGKPKMNWDDRRKVETLAENTIKKAATDGLKRAARLWGIGRYLLQAKNVNENNLANWLINVKRQWMWQMITTDVEILDEYHESHLKNVMPKYSDENKGRDIAKSNFPRIKRWLLTRERTSQKATT